MTKPQKPQKRPSSQASHAARMPPATPAVEGQSRESTPRTEGQRLLCALDGSNASIAAACGSSKPSVGSWRRGEKLPTPAARRAIEMAYPSVPATSWDVAPNSVTARRSSPARPGAAQVGEDLATIPEVEALLGAVRAAREAPGLLPGEVVKAIAEERALLALKARLERQERQDAEDAEDRIARSPAWTRLRDAIIRALVKYPEAAREVAGVIQGLVKAK